MSHHIPCITDSDEHRFPDEYYSEEVPFLSDTEKRIEWICSEWQEALSSNDYETWRDLRMMLHGASQTLIHCKHRHDDYAAIATLSDMAFKNSIQCIKDGSHE